MKAILERDYAVSPEGHTTYRYKAGEEVEGIVAEKAIKAGYAKKARKTTPKPEVTKPAMPDHEG